MKKNVDRRKFIRDVTICSGGIIISQWLPVSNLAADQTPNMVISNGQSIEQLVKASIDALGGISRFVGKGDIVALKPNIGWDRRPEQGANTHPDVVASLTKLCLGGGAKEVRVVDNTCNEPRRCYKRSGIQDAAENAGAKVLFFDDRKTTMMKVAGKKIIEWPVNRDIYEVDCLINVPVAKHHGLSRLSLGMKNWFGAVGGRRNKLHQDIDQTISDLAHFFKPKLVVLDAFRTLMKNGPQGGNLSDVKHPQIIAMGTDQVAIDAYGATLFDLNPDQIGFLNIATEMGVGTKNYASLNPKKVTI